MNLTCILVAAALLCGCATITQEDLDRREYRQIDRINRFYEYEQKCQLAGGLVHIEAQQGWAPRNGVPGRGDQYWCQM